MTQIVDDFITHLAGVTDENERKRLIAQVKLKAANLAPEEAFMPDVRSMREYLATEIETPPSLVWPTIAVRGEITATLGRAGKGKTTMNLNRIFAWSAGRSLFPGWCDKNGEEYLKPEKPLRTLIAENEGNAGMFHQKMGLMLYQGPLNEEEQELALDNLFVHGDGGYSGMKLDNPEGAAKLRASIEACQPDIVFIEPFRSLWRGEENSATDMNAVVDTMVGIATDYQCGIILSHHERKSGVGEDSEMMSAGRGSTVLEGVVAVMENFQSIMGGEQREMTWSKARYLPPPAPVTMTWDRETGWYNWVPKDVLYDSIIVALRESGDEPMTVKDLSEELNLSENKVRVALNALKDQSKVKARASQAYGGGTTGKLWTLPSSELESTGGLDI